MSLGDDAIRETRASTKQSFGVEHFLDGPHKIPAGTTAARPAAGRLGRLWWNTDTNLIEYDAGDRWASPAQGKAMAGGIMNETPRAYPSGVASEVVMPVTWADSGGLAYPQYNQMHMPPFDCWVIMHGKIMVDGAGGLGEVLNLEGWDNARQVWYNISSIYGITASVYETTAFYPMPAGRPIRLVYVNATGVTRTVTEARLTLGILGGY
ncbi:MAG: hypothetical protein C5B60_03865 [Chloroflexi bacterium]|nr:MAG: hypothetical protein C5B60_03865 [Chloroflexota bacterium]